MNTLTTNEQEIIDFEKRTGFPGRAEQLKLEEIGARYLTTPLFTLEGKNMHIEYMALGSKNGDLLVWKRISPLEKEFVIHGEFQGKKYS